MALATLAAGCAPIPEVAEREATEGLALARAGNLVEARAHFERAVALDEHNPKARYNLALTHLAAGDGARAADHLRRFLADHPADATARFELGRALAVAGDPEAALAELRRAVELGFADAAAMGAGGLESLEGNLAFVQLQALVGQRAGVPAELQAAAGTGYGGVPVGGAILPGTGSGPTCAR